MSYLESLLNSRSAVRILYSGWFELKQLLNIVTSENIELATPWWISAGFLHYDFPSVRTLIQEGLKEMPTLFPGAHFLHNFLHSALQMLLPQLPQTSVITSSFQWGHRILFGFLPHVPKVQKLPPAEKWGNHRLTSSVFLLSEITVLYCLFLNV